MQPTHDPSYLLQHVASVMQRQSDQILQERLGVGLSQYKILMMLQWEPNTTQKQIANSLGQTEASISRQVKLLHEKAMLTSQVDPTERRKHLARPTAKGAKVALAAQELLSQYQDSTLDALNQKERGLLVDMLRRIHEECCAPGKVIACDRAFAIETIYDSQK
ncbi:MAG TPA: MarR family winged helix-turn-helix transcriptional regulator [Candidatus Saccharimonadales bacterium]|nr:MarR family winged helix-turn-helix transcriptional regulator [Candidatus Saccharimonadales bacterium]